MSNLAAKTCIPCRGSVPALKKPAQEQLLKQLEDGWVIEHDHHLSRKYRFKNFVDALAFTNRVGELAEQQAHHPDILLRWGGVQITIWTHKIDGLTESDFILAAKIESLPR